MPRLPCPKFPVKCETAQRCAVDIASGACPFDPNKKGMYNKCCVTENCQPHIVMTNYRKRRDT